jgi:TPR repeat protein
MPEPTAASGAGDGASGAEASPEPDYLKLESLAVQGDARAQFELGARWEHGVGVPQDCTKAAEWYQKSADAGNPEAQAALGGLYEHGRGVATDSRIALKWYLKAAGQAFPGARLRYESLDAKEGRASAQFSMGRRFEEGDGVCQNLADAARWYQLAAAQGYSSAQFRLGTMRSLGLGLDRNIEDAVQWLTLAAQSGDTRAEYAVGNLYDTEESIRDVASAFAWYRRAAVKGHKDAQRRLAQLLARGLGVKRDAQEAAKWQALADQPVVESDPCGWDESWHGNPGWGGHR